MKTFNGVLAVAILLVLLSVSGCFGGSTLLTPVDEWPVLPDGDKVGGVMHKTKGFSGPDVTLVQVYRCPANEKCELNGQSAGTAAGLVETTLQGSAGAAALGVGMVGAAATLRPARTSINQEGAIANSKGGDGGKGGQGGLGIGLGGEGGKGGSVTNKITTSATAGALSIAGATGGSVTTPPSQSPMKHGGHHDKD